MTKMGENDIRRIAERQGYFLRRSRGSYKLVGNDAVIIMDGVSLEEIVRWLLA
jgi:hypothetical protein